LQFAAIKQSHHHDNHIITSYRLQANVAGLTDTGEVQIWSANRDASKQQLYVAACVRKAEREQWMKLRHRVNVETNQKQYKFI